MGFLTYWFVCGIVNLIVLELINLFKPDNYFIRNFYTQHRHFTFLLFWFVLSFLTLPIIIFAVLIDLVINSFDKISVYIKEKTKKLF